MRISLALPVCAAVMAATLFGAPAAAAASYALDADHTFVTFEIGHFGASVNRGRFEKKEGTLEFDRAGKTGKVDIRFHINSLTTGTPPFDQHLQGPEVLDAAKYPTARFVGDQFVFDGDKVISVSGTLTLKGKSAPVTFKARQFNCFEHPMLKREVCGGDFEATIDRSAFGVDYGLEYGFPRQVRLVAQIEGIRQ